LWIQHHYGTPLAAFCWGSCHWSPGSSSDQGELRPWEQRGTLARFESLDEGTSVGCLSCYQPGDLMTSDEGEKKRRTWHHMCSKMFFFPILWWSSGVFLCYMLQNFRNIMHFFSHVLHLDSGSPVDWTVHVKILAGPSSRDSTRSLLTLRKEVVYTRWCPLVIIWFINPINYRYSTYKS